MSTNREAGIGVCGVVVGIILGAGAILYTSDYTVKADLAGILLQGVSLAYRGMDIEFDREAYTRRAVSERDRETREPADVVTEPRYPRTPERIQERKEEQRKPQVPDSKCLAKLRVIAQVREAVKRLIPTGSDYAQLLERISGALDDATRECVQEIRAEQSQKAATVRKAARPTARVNNNDCEQYGKDTQRYTRCVVNQQQGQRYVGRQTTY